MKKLGIKDVYYSTGLQNQPFKYEKVKHLISDIQYKKKPALM